MTNLTPTTNLKGNSQKKGMVLAFAIVILVLMSLMAVIILSNTRTELNITGNNRVSREAFNVADSCARLATLMTVVLLRSGPEEITDVLRSLPSPSPKYPFDIIISPRFNIFDLQNEATNFKYTDRYLETGFGSPLGTMKEPHLIFKTSDGREFAKAVVNLETYETIPVGTSLGTGDPSDSSGGSRLQVGVVVSVTGKTILPPSGPLDEEPNSVVTIMYRNYLD
ncbi:MAG: hypothetical protein LBF22_15525 [Deltaproteobacteria bacterium]|nr:hypothetical protein [Deltaproteobacteria bacterium]